MQQPVITRRCFLTLCGATLLGLRPGPGHGADREAITALLSAEDDPYRQVAEALKSGLGDVGVRLVSVPAPLDSVAGKPLVALGYKAAHLAARSHDGPVLAALLPRAVYQTLLEHEVPRDARHRWSAVVLDQPWSRQVGLIRLVLPKASKIGVLVSADTGEAVSELRAAAKAQGMALEPMRVDDARELFPALRALLGKVDVLLAIPDRDLINRHTLEGYLISAYRAGVPVIGYSRAMVDAGALAAVYASPKDVGRQLVDILSGPARGRPSGLIQSEYFSVRVNRSVARSLELPVADEDSLQRRLEGAG